MINNVYDLLNAASASAAVLVAGTEAAAFNMDMLERLGLLGSLVFFFVWTSWKREQRLVERVTSLETHINQELTELIKNTNASIDAQSNTNKEVREALKGMKDDSR